MKLNYRRYLDNEIILMKKVNHQLPDHVVTNGQLLLFGRSHVEIDKCGQIQMGAFGRFFTA